MEMALDDVGAEWDEIVEEGDRKIKEAAEKNQLVQKEYNFNVPDITDFKETHLKYQEIKKEALETHYINKESEFLFSATASNIEEAKKKWASKRSKSHAI